MEIHWKRLFLKAAHTVLVCSKHKNINFIRQVKLMKGNQIRKTDWFLYFWENGKRIFFFFFEANVWLEINLNWRALKKGFSSQFWKTKFACFSIILGHRFEGSAKSHNVNKISILRSVLKEGRGWREFGPMRSNHSTRVRCPGIRAKPTDCRLARFSILWHLKNNTEAFEILLYFKNISCIEMSYLLKEGDKQKISFPSHLNKSIGA